MRRPMTDLNPRVIEVLHSPKSNFLANSTNYAISNTYAMVKKLKCKIHRLCSSRFALINAGPASRLRFNRHEYCHDPSCTDGGTCLDGGVKLTDNSTIHAPRVNFIIGSRGRAVPRRRFWPVIGAAANTGRCQDGWASPANVKFSDSLDDRVAVHGSFSRAIAASACGTSISRVSSGCNSATLRLRAFQ